MAHEDSHSLKQMLNPYCVPGTVQGKQKNWKARTQYLPRTTWNKRRHAH